MAGAVEPVEVDTAAGTVAVHVFGTGLPTVLWHGHSADASSWGSLLPALLPGRRLLVVDAPGWGAAAASGAAPAGSGRSPARLSSRRRAQLALDRPDAFGAAIRTFWDSLAG